MATEPSNAPRRQLSAILFADVYGYSRLMARNEERTCQRVTQAIRLIKSLVGDYEGRVERVAGDGILALFETAPKALQFAIAIQREFRNAAVWQGQEGRIAFRIGINLGEVLLGGEANFRGTASMWRRASRPSRAPAGSALRKPCSRPCRTLSAFPCAASDRADCSESGSRSRCSRSRSRAHQRRPQPNRRRSREVWCCLSWKGRSRSCRSKTFQAIRGTATLASPGTSIQACRAFAICW